MPQRYIEAIVKYLSGRDYQPLKPQQLARQMGIVAEDYGSFREAVKILRDNGRIVLGSKNALMLPEISSRMTGFFRANPRGFGFVIPETPNSHGDLFIPEGATRGAMTGDMVVARVYQQGRREGQKSYAGEIIEISKRGNNRFVGTLQESQGTWFVLPDGNGLTQPIVVRDVSTASPHKGTKVVVEIVQYPQAGDLPIGVIVETLGKKGMLHVETLSVIRAHGIEDEFTAEALEDARLAIAAFNPHQSDGRQDLAGMTIVTIDPPDARDFDDAISLEKHPDGQYTLGVHIADVSHFVQEGNDLDRQARSRGNSVYFPKKVVPMLPEILSNGVCSLQQDQRRFCQSAFIRYDSGGNVLGSKVALTVIKSARRLTYLEAQDIIDGKIGAVPHNVATLLADMNRLARIIEVRRRKAGMLHLDLPEVELIFDEQDRVIDAVPQDNAYTHTIIEMFMVEANEAVASLLNRLNRPCLRRIHPAPDKAGSKQLEMFVRAAGHKLPIDMTRRDMQELLERVKGKPESYAINLALLKTFEQAEYSPLQVGHFALASEHYCHFTSPIRRYPDLTVHRLVREHCLGTLGSRPSEDMSALVQLGESCNTTERRAQAAENELREVLILQFLETKVGEDFQGVITGVTNFGMFVQSPRFLIDGLVRFQDLGDDWWEVDSKLGMVTGERTGMRFRIGDLIDVRIAGVDIARRQLNLAPQSAERKKPKKAGKKPTKQGKPDKYFSSRKKKRGT